MPRESFAHIPNGYVRRLINRFDREEEDGNYANDYQQQLPLNRSAVGARSMGAIRERSTFPRNRKPEQLYGSSSTTRLTAGAVGNNDSCTTQSVEESAQRNHSGNCVDNMNQNLAKEREIMLQINRCMNSIEKLKECQEKPVTSSSLNGSSKPQQSVEKPPLPVQSNEHKFPSSHNNAFREVYKTTNLKIIAGEAPKVISNTTTSRTRKHFQPATTSTIKMIIPTNTPNTTSTITTTITPPKPNNDASRGEGQNLNIYEFFIGKQE